MVEPLYQSPSFDGVLPSLVFLQVLMSTFYIRRCQNDGDSQWINQRTRPEQCNWTLFLDMVFLFVMLFFFDI